jgi:6-pyruvoyltetrahydropterin/6-carboxytetrahydropterin synthase
MHSSTKIIELGSCAFRQPNAAFNRVNAGSNSKRCSYVHGYLLKAKFWFECCNLDDKNWVVDFGGLKELKDILEKQFDHTLCIDSQDPLLEEFKQLHEKGGCDLRIMEGGVGIERTAEWCFKVADTYIRNNSQSRCWVSKVEVWEHEKNSAIYTAL